MRRFGLVLAALLLGCSDDGSAATAGGTGDAGSGAATTGEGQTGPQTSGPPPGSDGGSATTATTGPAGDTDEGGTTGDPPSTVDECFANAYQNDPGIGPDYDQFMPTVGSHCHGTNHQRIEGSSGWCSWVTRSPWAPRRL